MDKTQAGRNETRRPRIRPTSNGKDTSTPWSQKEKASQGTGPSTGAEPCPRKGQPTEPRKRTRMIQRPRQQFTGNKLGCGHGRTRGYGQRSVMLYRLLSAPMESTCNGGTALGKRDNGQRDPVQECSPKRSRTPEAGETHGRMYIDVDVPGGPKEDGAPHWGYVVTAPQRGNRYQLWCPCTCNAPIKV